MLSAAKKCMCSTCKLWLDNYIYKIMFDLSVLQLHVGISSGFCLTWITQDLPKVH